MDNNNNTNALTYNYTPAALMVTNNSSIKIKTQDEDVTLKSIKVKERLLEEDAYQNPLYR